MEYQAKCRVKREEVMSGQAYQSSVDLFSYPLTDITEAEISYDKIYPDYTVEDSNNPVQFTIPASSRQTALRDSFLYLRFKITDKDGNALAANSKTYPKPNFFNNVFSSLVVDSNGKEFPSVTNFGPATFIHRVVDNTNDNDKEGRLLREMIAKESNPGTLDSTNSYIKYASSISTRQEFELCSKVNYGLFEQSRNWPEGMQLRLHFRRSTNAFALYGQDPSGSATFTDKITIVSAILYVKRVKLSDQIQTILQRERSEGKPYVMKADFFDAKSYTISKGAQSHVSENLISGKLPSFVVVGLYDSKAFHGLPSKSPVNFKDHGLSSINLLVDGVPQLINGLDFKVSSNEYMVGYQLLQQCTGTSWITPVDFAKNGFFLIPFDIRKAQKEGQFTTSREGTLKLQMNFHNELSDNVNVVVYTVDPTLISIDQHNQISIERM